MGTGCARGFLAAFDLVWMTRRWCLLRQALNNNHPGGKCLTAWPLGQQRVVGLLKRMSKALFKWSTVGFFSLIRQYVTAIAPVALMCTFKWNSSTDTLTPTNQLTNSVVEILLRSGYANVLGLRSTRLRFWPQSWRGPFRGLSYRTSSTLRLSLAVESGFGQFGFSV